MKWSLDRACTIGGFATTQMNAGSLEKPEQFVVVDDKTFRVDFLRKDKMTLPNLAVTIPSSSTRSSPSRIPGAIRTRRNG